MAAPAPSHVGTFRQFAFLSFHTALDAFMAITNADPQGNIPVSHDVINHLVQVSEADGNTVQELLQAAGINVKGETIDLPLEEVWSGNDSEIYGARINAFAGEHDMYDWAA